MDFHLVFGSRLLIAALLGSAIGLEREIYAKPAGLRTNLLICLGSALLMQISLAIPSLGGVADPGRIAAQVVVGIGFIGAGTILHSRHAVHGLTSAATIWVVMAVGMLTGAGFELQAVLATALILGSLVALRHLEHRLFGQHVMTMVLSFHDTSPEPQALFAQAGIKRRILRTQRINLGNSAGKLSLTWRGSDADADRLDAAIGTRAGLVIEQWEVEE